MDNCRCVTALARYRCRHSLPQWQCELDIISQSTDRACPVSNTTTMEAKTLTTLGQLRDGDRFFFAADGKRTVWEVIEQNTKQAFVNEATAIPGSYVYLQPKPKAHDTQVVFLRHTKESLFENDALKGKI